MENVENTASPETKLSAKWLKRFARVAKQVSTWSKDPGTQVGCVIVSNEKRILATGYNGLPYKYDDKILKELPREEKYVHVVHAEMNAILNAARYGIPLRGTTLIIYGLPMCSECAKHVVSAGIGRVISWVPGEFREKWKRSTEYSKIICERMNVEYEIIEKL